MALRNPSPRPDPALKDRACGLGVVNKTGYELKHVYIAPSASDEWGNDVMGRDVLGDGEGAAIHFVPGAKTCHWDLKVVYTVDDSNAVWHEVNLCDISNITIHYNKATDSTTATAE